MGENQALAQFATGNDDEAQRALDALSVEARRKLHAYLWNFKDLREEHSDVVQETLLHAWNARAGFRDQGSAAWHGFLRTTARNLCLDRLRRRKARPERLQDGAVLDERAEGEWRDTVGALMDALATQAAQQQADVLWLGLDPTLLPEAHTRRLLAAKYFYLDGLTWEKTLRGLGQPGPGDPPLTRAVLDEWLADPGVLRHLAYDTLYYHNDRLAAHLLGLEDPDDLGALEAVTREAAGADPDALGPGGWTWAETSVILWRYRNALLFEHILDRSDCTLSKMALTTLIERTFCCFPFSLQMESLLARVGARGRKPLSDKMLWQRLAFQYWVADELPHKDIQHRTQPAYRHVAPPAQPEITLQMLNGWLSNGRLLERLARAVRGQKRGDDEE